MKESTTSLPQRRFSVTGMSCAACSMRVERAVSKVPGVTSCSVSLLTNEMSVTGTATDEAIVAAVVKAGFGATPVKCKIDNEVQDFSIRGERSK